MITLEITRLEVAGAERRVLLARRALEDFLKEQAGKVYDADLAQSIDHERQSLECEVDAADRRHQECLLQYQELQDQETVKI